MIRPLFALGAVGKDAVARLAAVGRSPDLDLIALIYNCSTSGPNSTSYKKTTTFMAISAQVTVGTRQRGTSSEVGIVSSS